MITSEDLFSNALSQEWAHLNYSAVTDVRTPNGTWSVVISRWEFPEPMPPTYRAHLVPPEDPCIDLPLIVATKDLDAKIRRTLGRIGKAPQDL